MASHAEESDGSIDIYDDEGFDSGDDNRESTADLYDLISLPVPEEEDIDVLLQPSRPHIVSNSASNSMSNDDMPPPPKRRRLNSNNANSSEPLIDWKLMQHVDVCK